jgi:elongator complex protein 3
LKNNFFDELNGAAIIRELHTYGEITPIGKIGSQVQHFGLGKKLIAEAEKICRQKKIGKIAVISGIGVKDYYRKLGYKQIGTYLAKNLS